MWRLWPGAQFVNFKYVPLEYRVLVVNGISIGEFVLLLRWFQAADLWL